jgi:CO/xanthine dehydrogenase FAD-binding subunit
MKPARFDYVRAESIAEAHELLAAEGGEASVLAGGQSLLPLLSTRLARPKVVLDIMRIPGLDAIARESDAIRIGAGVRQATLAAWPELADAQPLLARALPRPAAAAPYAARSRTPTRAPKSRWCCSRSPAKSCSRIGAGCAACRRQISSPA